MPKAKALRVTVPKDEQPYVCSTCWYYESETEDFGKCYGHAPQVLVSEDGDPQFIRVRVQPFDTGCPLWRARHTA